MRKREEKNRDAGKEYGEAVPAHGHQEFPRIGGEEMYDRKGSTNIPSLQGKKGSERGKGSVAIDSNIEGDVLNKRRKKNDVIP